MYCTSSQSWQEVNKPHSIIVPELHDEVFSFPDDTHCSLLWVSVIVSVKVRGGVGADVRAF